MKPSCPAGSRVRAAAAGLLSLAISAPSFAQTEVATLPADLTQLSLDELLNIEVTSVSKRAEPMVEAAAAIFVLTGEDIRRSGVRSIAEALRLVPGLHVARTDVQTQTYAISARGFNSGLADKLEVLLDGRSVYSPLFSGVFWDVLDTHLPDVDRIEVIRGPGATLWGANAVNGVINIVTKSASDTQGIHITAGGGDEERAFGSVRSGGRLGEAGHLRMYAQALDRDAAATAQGDDAADGQRLGQAGFRSDWRGGPQHEYSVMGDVYDGVRDSPWGEIEADGANLLGRWSWRGSAASRAGLKVYYDRYHRKIPTVYEEHRETLDVDFDHHVPLGDRHDLVYGLGYRNSLDDTGGPPRAYIFDPARRRLETYSAFVQDQVGLASTATFTIGSKFEHNDFTGFELQPSVRLGWQPRERLFTWTAVSRAVRTPNRFDSDLAVYCSQFLVDLGICQSVGKFGVGNPRLESEKLVAYEWGLRWWTERGVSADLAVFYNDYDDLRSAEVAPPFGRFGNGLEGAGSGAELNVSWRAAPTLHLRAFCSYLDLDLRAKPESTDQGSAATTSGSNPHTLAGLDGNWQFRPGWSLNGLLRYAGAMPASGVSDYTELNLRLGFRPWDGFEVSAGANNLLESHHAEFGIPNVPPLEAQQGYYALLEWAL